MFSDYLKQTNPKTADYFEKLFKKYFDGKKNIPNSIILWGSDTLAQYFFALEIARILNCQKNRENNCDCINCKWIYNNEHPEIKTVTKLDSKSKAGEAKCISVEQVNNILNETSKKIQDYQVVIFCDADYEKISANQIAHLNNFGELKTAIKQKGEKYFVPKPLSARTINETASNALLKTIEETPENMLFIFLTAMPNDLISTIVSRSQMFYIQNTFNKSYDFSVFKEIFKDYPETKKEDFYEFSQKSINYITSKDISLTEYLENMQAYFTELLTANYSSPAIKNRILNTIENIIRAKKYKSAVIKDEYILDDLWVNIP